MDRNSNRKDVKGINEETYREIRQRMMRQPFQDENGDTLEELIGDLEDLKEEKITRLQQVAAIEAETTSLKEEIRRRQKLLLPDVDV